MTRTNDQLMKKWMATMSLVAAAAAVVLHNAAVAAAKPQVPCLFLFGDSLIDPGNNNGRNTIAQVEFKPYGIDFLLGPTGRFSNGKTIADIVAELLGFEEYIPSFLEARGQQILRGVNYASAASGIRPETGYNWGERITFDEQLDNFKITMTQLENMVRDVPSYLNKCIFLCELGNNDFLNNYFQPTFYNTSKLYTLENYTSIVIQRYSEQLQILYNFGARKLALVGAAPLGCIPFTLAISSTDGRCVEATNRASLMFNEQLKAKIDVFNADFPEATFTYIDGYNPINDVLTNPAAYGFQVNNKACCGLSSVICLPNDVVCSNRSEYVYWDFAHPSETTNILLARRVYEAEKPTDAYPYDLRRLALL
ncbi:GDSL esterase/lipase At5g45670-like isoform X1 [Salvia miltiorrhiza]|uniref:GDSL esterase/lipase At5g45670-like isoform X1 n=1 Tax=Salvia miltiorrhiza TaxID=226208 RepID=UPI0025AB6716|nr:GDSL esterase/lipase At5g45670-like isoform X1 [Salvia miltiorrhiza]